MPTIVAATSNLMGSEAPICLYIASYRVAHCDVCISEQ
jgi:hypothetical protein